MVNKVNINNLNKIIELPLRKLWVKNGEIVVAKWYHRIIRFITNGYFINKKILNVANAALAKYNIAPLNQLNPQAIVNIIQYQRQNILSRDINYRVEQVAQGVMNNDDSKPIDADELALFTLGISQPAANPGQVELKNLGEQHTDLLKRFLEELDGGWAPPFAEQIIERLNNGVNYHEFGFKDIDAFLEFLEIIGDQTENITRLNFDRENLRHSLPKLLHGLDAHKCFNIRILSFNGCSLVNIRDDLLNLRVLENVENLSLIDNRLDKNTVTSIISSMVSLQKLNIIDNPIPDAQKILSLDDSVEVIHEFTKPTNNWQSKKPSDAAAKKSKRVAKEGFFPKVPPTPPEGKGKEEA